MAVQDRPAPEALTDRVPPVALLLTGATSVQFGAALAATLFDDVGPAGTSMLRLVLSAAVLALFWRPAIRGLRAADRRLVVAFGLALGLMNFSFYEALDRVPLGVAVTIEFIGPVSVAVALSRRRLDFLWIALAVAGIVLLADPFGAGGIDPVGLVFVLVAAACWAAYILLAQRTAGRFRGGEGLALAALVAALVPIVPGVAEAGSDLLAPEILALGALVAAALVGHPLLAGDRRAAAHARPPLRRAHEPRAGRRGDRGPRRARPAPRRPPTSSRSALVVAAAIGVTRAPGRPSPSTCSNQGRPAGILRACSRSTRPTC